MDYPDPKNLVWHNICRLMGYDPEVKEPSIDIVQKRVKVGRGTVQRIKEKEAATRLDSLTTIAQNLGVPVWRLLQGDDALSPAALEAAAAYLRSGRETGYTARNAGRVPGAVSEVG